VWGEKTDPNNEVKGNYVIQVPNEGDRLFMPRREVKLEEAA